MNKLTAVLASATLVFGAAACGSDDDGGSSSGESGSSESDSGDSGDGGGGGGSDAKSALLAEMTAGGTEGLDEQCLEDKVNDLDDDDAAFILDNFDYEGDDIPEGASAEAINFVTSIFECIDFSDIDLGDIDLGDLSE